MTTPTNRPAYTTTGIAVAQSGLTDLAIIDVSDVARLSVEIAVTGQALDAFVILARFHPSGSYQTLFSTADEFTFVDDVATLLVGSSGDLTTLAVGSGWFILDTLGIDAIKLQASSGNVAGSTVALYVGGQ